jgi:hypothetical protein
LTRRKAAIRVAEVVGMGVVTDAARTADAAKKKVARLLQVHLRKRRQRKEINDKSIFAKSI